MVHYCVNKNVQQNGDHEVHKIGCRWYPQLENRLSLGEHTNCSSAVIEAKKPTQSPMAVPIVAPPVIRGDSIFFKDIT